MGVKKTQDEFEKELYDVLPNIKVLGEYINTNTKIHCKCLIHDYEFDALPINMLHGHACKMCGKEKLSKFQTKTHDQFVKDVFEINKDIEIISEYIDIKHYVKCRCKIDGYEWSAMPRSILRGRKCPVCTNRKVMQGVNDIATTHPELVRYFKNKEESTMYSYGCGKEIEVICPVCGEESIIRINNLSNNFFSCNSCYEKKYGRRRVPNGYWNKETMTDFVNENMPGYKILDVKKKGEDGFNALKVFIKCPNENHEPYWAYWKNIADGYRCEACAAIADVKSKGEIKTNSVLHKYNINFIPQKRFEDCKDKYTLPFDFYLPDYNLIIEIMGEQHEYPVNFFGGEENFELRVKHDKMKREYLKNNNIDILDIWYYDFNHIEEIILNKLNSCGNFHKILSTAQN